VRSADELIQDLTRGRPEITIEESHVIDYRSRFAFRIVGDFADGSAEAQQLADVEEWSAIARRAFENHVLELALEGSRLWNRKRVERNGKTDSVSIDDAEREGEYPDTRINLLVYDRNRDHRRWDGYAIWRSPLSWEDGSLLSPARIAGDISMWAVGG